MKEVNEITLHQVVVLEDEIGISVRYIKDALGRIKEEFKGNNETSHALLLHLAQGFERLLKVTFCFYHYNKTGRFPAEKVFMKEYGGHDIQWLWKRLIQVLEDEDILKDYVAIDDSISWLRNDTKFEEFMQSISSFGDQNRYFNLNYVIGKETDYFKSPPQLLSQSYNKWVEEEPEWYNALTKATPDTFREDYIKLFREYTLHLTQVLCRILRWGLVGPEAVRISAGKIGDFLSLSKEEIIHNDGVNLN